MTPLDIQIMRDKALASLTDQKREVFDALTDEPVRVAYIASKAPGFTGSKNPDERVRRVLSEMEKSGLVERCGIHPNIMWRKTRS